MQGGNATQSPALPPQEPALSLGQTDQGNRVERGTGGRRGARGRAKRGGMENVSPRQRMGLALPCPAGCWRVPGHSAHPLAATPRTRVLQPFSRQRGRGQGGLQRPPARSALHSPPLSPSPRRQLECCFTGAQGSGRASRAGCRRLLCATTPGLPLLHAFVPRCSCARPQRGSLPACWSLAAATHSGPGRHTLSARPPAPLREQSCLSASRRLLRVPGATCTSPETLARPAPQRGGADVLWVCPATCSAYSPGSWSAWCSPGLPSQRLPDPACLPYPRWWPGLSVSSGPCSG